MSKLVFLLITIGVFGILVTDPISASTDTIGPNGIRSAGLLDFDGIGLTGAGINIGQLEPFRPGLTGFDTSVNCCNDDVVPADVIVRDMGANVNQSISDHAIAVAGVMISNATTAPVGHFPPTGVAPEAILYSGAHNALPNDQPNAALTGQTIASLGGVRAINMSFGMSLEEGKWNRMAIHYLRSSWTGRRVNLIFCM